MRLDLLAAPRVDPRTTTSSSAPLTTTSTVRSRPPRTPLASARIDIDEPERIVVNVAAMTPRVLVPPTPRARWSVTVDGVARRLRQANYFVRAVVLRPGIAWSSSAIVRLACARRDARRRVKARPLRARLARARRGDRRRIAHDGRGLHQRDGHGHDAARGRAGLFLRVLLASLVFVAVAAAARRLLRPAARAWMQVVAALALVAVLATPLFALVAGAYFVAFYGLVERLPRGPLRTGASVAAIGVQIVTPLWWLPPPATCSRLRADRVHD
jgi:hypothetical protein